jgi:murein DD-endopeptidase MepM/ murein hydrolase activator NlpD
VYPGQAVKRGDLIALSGATGNATGPFLGFQVRFSPFEPADGWGGYSDPLPFLEGLIGRGQLQSTAF